MVSGIGKQMVHASVCHCVCISEFVLAFQVDFKDLHLFLIVGQLR